MCRYNIHIFLLFCWMRSTTGGREKEKAAAKVKQQHEGSNVFQMTCSDTTAFSSLVTSERVHEGIAKPFGVFGVFVSDCMWWKKRRDWKKTHFVHWLCARWPVLGENLGQPCCSVMAHKMVVHLKHPSFYPLFGFDSQYRYQMLSVTPVLKTESVYRRNAKFEFYRDS